MKRRWFQYSLRTLMFLVTVLCLWLGLHVYRVEQQRAAVRAVERLEGSCENVLLAGFRSGWSSHGRLRDHLYTVTEVGVPENSHVDAEVMRHLGNLPKLRAIGLSGGAADEDLAHLGNLSHLEELGLEGDLITDAGVAHLGGLTRLRRLHLGGSRITDAGLGYLRNLRNLEWLGLSQSDVTDAGLIHLRNMKKLEYLNLDGTRITDGGLVHLEGLSKLRILSLEDTAVSSKGLAHLGGLKNLEDLNLSGTAIADGDLNSIAGLRKLSDLNLSRTEITTAALAGLRTMTQLRHLDLKDSAITDGGLAQLGGLCDLKSLWLNDTAITDEGLRHLPVFRKLEVLGLSGTRVTGPGLRQLKDHGVIRSVHLLNTKLSEWPQLPNTSFDGGGSSGSTSVFPAPARLPCFGRRLVGDATPSARELFAQLAYNDTATTALASGLGGAKGQRLLYDQDTGAERELAGAAFVRTPAGIGAALMLGPRDTQCFGDMEIMPAWHNYYKLLLGDRLIGLDAGGRPAWAATRKSQWSAMAVVDADGDGYYEELVRWNTDYERADHPFLVIHDLTRPNLPAMLAIELYDHKAPKRLRWSFRPGRRPYRDVVLEEKQDGRFRVVTVFPYRPESRTWDLEAAQPRACWRRLDDPRIRLDFESL